MLVRAVVLMTAALLVAAAAADDDWVDVELQHGTIRGTKVQLGDARHFYSFKGIPYAQPPVGELRFRVSLVRLIIFFVFLSLVRLIFFFF